MILRPETAAKTSNEVSRGQAGPNTIQIGNLLATLNIAGTFCRAKIALPYCSR
jgi:hypothetical protein